MNPILNKVISVILPPRCICCGKVLTGDDGLCEDCFNALNFISSPHCKKCGTPLIDVQDHQFLCGKCISDNNHPFRLSRSSLEYDDISRPLLLSFKFMDRTENAKVFAKWLKLSASDILEQGVDIIVPIPLHYTRLIKRRYNQSALIAKELSKLTNIETDYTSVVRHKRTKPQARFSGSARYKNVHNAFSVKKPVNIEGKRVLLLDDVMTTSSTLKECAKAILNAGALSVDTLTIARVTK